MKALDECYLREYRAQAGLDIAYCVGMATANTNANDVAIRLVAEMIRGIPCCDEIGGCDQV